LLERSKLIDVAFRSSPINCKTGKIYGRSARGLATWKPAAVGNRHTVFFERKDVRPREPVGQESEKREAAVDRSKIFVRLNLIDGKFIGKRRALLIASAVAHLEQSITSSQSPGFIVKANGPALSEALGGSRFFMTRAAIILAKILAAILPAILLRPETILRARVLLGA
jgi:hypothetical protein